MGLGSLKMALEEFLLLVLLFSAMSRDLGSQSHLGTQQPTTASPYKGTEVRKASENSST